MKKNIYEATYLDMLKDELSNTNPDMNKINGIQDNIDITEPDPLKFEKTEFTDHINSINEKLSELEQQFLAWQAFYNDSTKVEAMGYDPEAVKEDLMNIQNSLQAVNNIKQHFIEINKELAVLEDANPQ